MYQKISQNIDFNYQIAYSQQFYFIIQLSNNVVSNVVK